MAGHDRDVVVERVREAVDIVEWIGTHVELRPAGRNFKARCPFHQEKTPSFIVSPDKQVFHCFGCGVGGDVFSFVMKHDGLSFPEALELLARRAGIALPERAEREGPNKAELIAALREAVRFYRGQLRSAAAEVATTYLRNRGMPGRILDLYYVGYAPPEGRALLDHLSSRFSREVLTQADLIGATEEGRLYDRFRGRIMMPILGRSGEPIAFGARAIKPETEPKYLNSRETAVYRKRGELFGLPQARQAIRKTGAVLVVEGYFDVLSLAGAGLYHAVAPCGTAWRMEHTESLLRLREGSRIIFLFDGDAAGRTAGWRALGATLPRHVEVEMALLPPGKDPDDLVRGGEVERLKEVLAAPLTPVAFGIEVLRGEGLAGSALLTRIAEMVSRVGQGIAREMMIDEVAERGRLPVRTLRREVEALRSRLDRRSPGTAPSDPLGSPPPRMSPLEELLLRQIQAEPAAAGALVEAARGVPGVGAGVRNVLVWVEDRIREGDPPAPPELLRRVRAELGDGVEAGFLLAEDLPAPNARLRQDLLRRLREQALEAENERIGYEIRSLEKEGAGPTGGGGSGGEHLAGLLARKQALAQELGRLRQGEERTG
ncbi:MAG: DNA primase [Candidatus Eisenbacteria bacterium]